MNSAMRRASGGVIGSTWISAAATARKKRCLCYRARLPADHIGGLGEHERRGEDRACVADRARAGLVVVIGVVGGREQDARVDDEHPSVSTEAVGEKIVRAYHVGADGGATLLVVNEPAKELRGSAFRRRRRLRTPSRAPRAGARSWPPALRWLPFVAARDCLSSSERKV